jgi:hypothetical protein
LKHGALVFFKGSFEIQLSFGRMFFTEKKRPNFSLSVHINAPENLVSEFFH